MHDPLQVHDVVTYELRQRAETGYDVARASQALADTHPDDEVRLEEIYADLLTAPRAAGWAFEEPDGLAEILDSRPAGGETDRGGPVDPDRILGGWLGRIAGCNLGKPVENGDFWTSQRIRSYLELAGAYPLRDYLPVLDPMPDGFVLQDCWPETTRGRLRGSARDDDIDYTILGLHLLEQHGPGLDRRTVATAWLAYLPYLRVFTAERTAYANLLRGVPLAEVAEVRNPYREWIGALIRGDVFGWVWPGRPAQAARLAYVDASLSHRGNGIYGEMWAAALVACAGTAGSVLEAFEQSLGQVPARSRLAEVLRLVRQLHAEGRAWEDALAAVQVRYGHYSWVHTVNNAGTVAAGLLWGEGDYATTVGLTVQGGWDTDSNAATAGSVAGTVLGARRLPGHFVDPLEDRTRSAVFGYDHSRISALAARTADLAAGALSGRTPCPDAG